MPLDRVFEISCKTFGGFVDFPGPFSVEGIDHSWGRKFVCFSVLED